MVYVINYIGLFIWLYIVVTNWYIYILSSSDSSRGVIKSYIHSGVHLISINQSYIKRNKLIFRNK